MGCGGQPGFEEEGREFSSFKLPSSHILSLEVIKEKTQRGEAF